MSGRPLDGPNLQVIPVRTELGTQIRRALANQWTTHKAVTLDYTQIERRILEYLCSQGVR